MPISLSYFDSIIQGRGAILGLFVVRSGRKRQGWKIESGKNARFFAGLSASGFSEE